MISARIMSLFLVAIISMSTNHCPKERENDKSSEDIQTVTIRSTTFRNYWVKFHNRKIEIGHQGECSPILSFIDRQNIKEEEDGREFVQKEVTFESPKFQTKTAEWKPVSGGVIPEDALYAGNDPNCPLFVGRAYHEGDQLPGKICKSNKSCYVAWGGREHIKMEYEVLTGNHYKWVPYLNPSILVNAVPGGMTEDGTTLYIGRTTYNNALTPGKVYPPTGLLYIGYAGLERTFREFDILVFTST